MDISKNGSTDMGRRIDDAGDMDNSNILITGGTGFLGSHLTEALQKKYGENVFITILDNNSLGSEENLKSLDKKNIRIIKGSVLNSDDVKNAAKDVDYVFHLAAMPFIPDAYKDPEIFISTNIMGTYNVIREIVGKPLKAFVYMSTSEVYGSAQKVPIDESHPIAPRSTYAASKYAAESLAFTLHKEKQFPLTIIRGFNFYGPKDSHPRIIPEIIRQFSLGKDLNLGNINSTRDFVYVRDTAEGVIAAAECIEARGKIINLATGVETPLKSLIDQIAKIYGYNDYKIHIKDDRLRSFEVDRLCGSSRFAKQVLGWTPKVSLHNGLKETIAWHKEAKRWPFEKRK